MLSGKDRITSGQGKGLLKDEECVLQLKRLTLITGDISEVCMENPFANCAPECLVIYRSCGDLAGVGALDSNSNFIQHLKSLL